LKTLIILDRYVTEELWRKCFKEKLGYLYNKLEMIFLEIKPDHYMPYKGIKEFVGEPLEIVKEIKDVEILVIQFAPVSEETIEAGKNLKLIACNRSTPVNVDLDAATKLRIQVIKATGRTADSAADFTLGLLLAEVRHIARAFEAVRKGTYPEVRVKKWRESVPELAGKTMGIGGRRSPICSSLGWQRKRIRGALLRTSSWRNSRQREYRLLRVRQLCSQIKR